ncbi:maestro heat-like repeat family member 5 [Mauremys mutica]|uniref:maestro heat-like repeat family member 5 n=1 Tax=Mauremys mutica TaxID=74926 RepID=UPI001D16EF9D|nr:maestro heat-like repeat family member 5 [Mauremys mutica]
MTWGGVTRQGIGSSPGWVTPLALVSPLLCTQTLKTMDEMLKALVCKDQEPNLLALQIILKVLLPWTTSKEVHERLRAVGRITWLMEFMGSQCKFQEVEEFSVLGQLVGCLTLCCAELEQEIWQLAVEGLHHVYSFMLQLKCKSTGDPCPS